MQFRKNMYIPLLQISNLFFNVNNVVLVQYNEDKIVQRTPRVVTNKFIVSMPLMFIYIMCY